MAEMSGKYLRALNIINEERSGDCKALYFARDKTYQFPVFLVFFKPFILVVSNIFTEKLSV